LCNFRGRRTDPNGAGSGCRYQDRQGHRRQRQIGDIRDKHGERIGRIFLVLGSSGCEDQISVVRCLGDQRLEHDSSECGCERPREFSLEHGVAVRQPVSAGRRICAVSSFAVCVGTASSGDVARQLILTLSKLPVTLVKNGTSTGGGGTKIFSFAEGLILPKGGSTNLTVANALDKSFLASVGSAAAGTDGSLTSTEANMLPQTAATTTSGAGTCKMKSTVSVPVPGTPLDGTSSPIAMYLNACLNADATGGEALTFSGTITINFEPLGDN
jgi:hypothetical protein